MGATPIPSASAPVRRGQTILRGPHHGLSSPSRPEHRDRQDIQHLRFSDGPLRGLGRHQLRETGTYRGADYHLRWRFLDLKFCYVDNEVDGILRFVDSGSAGPMNIAFPTEFTMLELADAVRQVTGSDVPVVRQDLLPDDFTQRCPDITLAAQRPRVDLLDGLARTAGWLRSTLANA